MKNKITVIISIRNRDASRIENQVNSIRQNGADPSFHIVDYGSDEEYVKQYEDLCEKMGLRYTHMFAEGLPWDKCKALNYGAKVATTPYIVTSDADMIYEGNPFKWCLDNFEDKCFYHAECYWLSKDGSKKKAKAAGHGNPGGFCFSSRKAFFDIGGYDERIVYWGYEDLDFPSRLVKYGYKQIWLPKEYKIFHVYHPSVSNPYTKPETSKLNTLKYCLENSFNPVLRKSFGLPLSRESRPILDFMKEKEPFTVNFEINKLANWLSCKEFTDILKEHEFIKLNLSERLKCRPLDRFRENVKTLLKPIVALTGTKIVSNMNENFDFFYEFLPVLKQNGLKDYFISSDVTCVYLLWNVPKKIEEVNETEEINESENNITED